MTLCCMEASWPSPASLTADTLEQPAARLYRGVPALASHFNAWQQLDSSMRTSLCKQQPLQPAGLQQTVLQQCHTAKSH